MLYRFTYTHLYRVGCIVYSVVLIARAHPFHPPHPLTGIRYRYMSDMLALESCFSGRSPGSIIGGTAPLRFSAWYTALRAHPDRSFVSYICTGLQIGFRIGFARHKPLRNAASNMLSAMQHPEQIDEYLEKELRLGRMLGPFRDLGGLPPVHISRFGVIPKGHNTGKWRLITDLSFPPGNIALMMVSIQLFVLSVTPPWRTWPQ